MNIKAIRSDEIYRKMMTATNEEKENIYRYELMKPFEFKWQFMQWNPNITPADMIVSEGLAENFAASMFGEDKIGKWVTETSAKTLETVIKPMIKANLTESDRGKLSSFLCGDEIMAMRGGVAVGMPYCGGYACGYALIAHYLKKTGKSIFEATITSTTDILKETEDFWN
ncbi:MAG: DUF2268 domain-containing putative Zn-dependent protease [Christensenella sp.]